MHLKYEEKIGEKMPDYNNLNSKFGKTYKSGERIFSEGDIGNELYIIREGKVRISKNAGNREIILAVLGKGDFFGEMAIINNIKRSTNAEAITDISLLCFNREGFTGIINKNSSIAMNIIDNLCKRLVHMNIQIQHLVKKDEPGLIALNLKQILSEKTDKSQGTEYTIDLINFVYSVP